MSRKVGMAGRLRKGEEESVCNPVINLLRYIRHLFTIHRLVRYDVINTGIMRRAAHPVQIIIINSLSVMYLPSSAGMLSGRIFAVTVFQS